MSGLLFLTSEDFKIERAVKDGKETKVLCNNIRGFTLVFFYAKSCQHCVDFLPVFRTLPGTMFNCQFAIVNIEKNMECIKQSQSTTTPIRFVPYLILYLEGRPYMIYNGERTVEDIGDFIANVTRNIEQRQTFARKPVPRPESKENKEAAEASKGIPAYTVGHPVCGNDKVCYLDFAQAYQS